jgi:DNA invertase Pin-like site-specific DNA recombinase
MKVIGYIRVSNEKQDFDSQKHRLLEYAQQHKLIIDELLSIEISSRKTTKARRIDELLAKLNTGDMLLVTELSRLGRNMLETLIIVNELTEKGIKIVFVRQPELSTTGPHGKLLLAIYSYFAETEREFISMRTKDGLLAAKADGKQLGRPKGSKSRVRRLTPFHDQIKGYLGMGLSLGAILKIVNNQLSEPVTYNTLKYYVAQEETLQQQVVPYDGAAQVAKTIEISTRL